MESDPTRRDVFRLLAAAAVVLSIPEAEAAVPPAVATFSDVDALRAILAAIYGPGADETDAVAALAESLGYAGDDRQALIATLPTLFDEGSRVLVPTLRAFRELDDDEQQRALLDWATSPIALRRQVYGALRLLLLFHAYTDPRTWPAFGYPGPLLGRAALPVHPLRFGEP